MNNFLLKTQINDNPPQVWSLFEPFNINNNRELKKNLNHLMQTHFLGLEYSGSRSINPISFRYYIGKQVLLDGDLVNKCFTRESVKAHIANTIPPPSDGDAAADWEGTLEEFVLAIPDDKFNAFLVPYNLSIPAFDKPSSYRDTLKILRTTGEDTLPSGDNVQYIDAFDFLKEHLENHVSELDNSGFSVAILKGDVIVFTTAAMIVEPLGRG